MPVSYTKARAVPPMKDENQTQVHIHDTAR